MTPILPALWLIVLIVGFPRFSEAVYSPSLPAIAQSLQTTESLVEYTLTIYLIGFSIGIFLWGQISDRVGRKPCLLIGITIFLAGCFGCFSATSINDLMISRLVQALGASVGSVLGQSICRDAFHGPKLGKVYSIMGGTLAICPALGPVVGGLIADFSDWSTIFLFLMLFAVSLFVIIYFRLPETHLPSNRQVVSFRQVVKKMLLDKKVIGLGLIVAACNGIYFSYFAEAPFFFIELLGLTPSRYGSTFLATAIAAGIGGLVSRKLHQYYSIDNILNIGLQTVFVGCSLFSLFILLSYWFAFSNLLLILMTIFPMMVIMAGTCIVTSNALAMALENFKWCIGTASSLFGSFYYAVISIFSLGMGKLHNDTLFPMPFYFLGIAIFMMFVQYIFIKEENLVSVAN